MRKTTFQETETECVMISIEVFPKYWDGSTIGSRFPMSERLLFSQSGFNLVSNCMHDIQPIDIHLLEEVNVRGKISFKEVCQIWGLSQYKFS